MMARLYSSGAAQYARLPVARASRSLRAVAAVTRTGGHTMPGGVAPRPRACRGGACRARFAARWLGAVPWLVGSPQKRDDAAPRQMRHDRHEERCRGEGDNEAVRALSISQRNRHRRNLLKRPRLDYG